MMMNRTLRVSNVEFIEAEDDLRATGLLAFLTITVNDRVRVRGLTLRRTRSGHVSVSFPEKRDIRGRDHVIFEPLDDATRRDLTQQILERLDLERR